MATAISASPGSERDRLALVRTDLLRSSAWIDGAWIAGDRTIEVRNPATGGVLGTVPDLGAEETRRAVAAAERALPEWKARTARERGVILMRWHALVIAHIVDLARLLTAEQGKPVAEARGEIGYGASFLEWFAEEGKRAYGEIIPGHQRDKRLIVLAEPVGVVGAITPWNFPMAMITRKVAPALAAGCTVVLKPSELTPYSALALAVLAEEAGVPAGVFNVVTGAPHAIGEVLTTDPRVRKFTFTGSTAVGKLLAARCMSTVKRVSLELGGNAPFLVFDDADVAAAVDGIMTSKFRNAGQTCVSANRIYVQRGVYDAVAERLATRAGALRVGDGLTGATDHGPLINDAAFAKVARHVDDALAAGARALTGGGRHALGGTFFAPTVLADVRADAVLTREETFGPVAALIPFDTEAEAIALANASPAGLAAYAYTNDLARSWRLAHAIDVGMLGLNSGMVSSEVAPFGGTKESGIGREGSRHGLDEFLERRLVVIGGVTS
ncbi:MAG: NAD-dependent succinate-semialdehyde dehydrogenase [Gemmatimonadaceae bacterium]|jgi:succinate-semialdehyde dehydrogenase/glutarate-semialdehyde dehydrogenase|nr:NAD-dependent succinate-semialdehyde dehydrogenase [Gemmatimonadaceae bacterium]